MEKPLDEIKELYNHREIGKVRRTHIMYQDSNMLASIRKVEAAREENAKLDPPPHDGGGKGHAAGKNSIPTTAPNSLPNCASAPTRAKRFRWNWRNCWRVNRASCTSSLI